MTADRITYDGGEMLRILENEFSRLNPLRYDSRYQSLLGKVIIDKLNRWDAAIREQKSEPLTLVVCGEFKRGKSSLINALLGEDIVTTDITTETITVNKICYGAHSNEIVLQGGKRIRISDEELKSEKLRTILKESPGGCNRLLLKRPLELLKRVTVIDTPGLGDSLADFKEDVETALRMADAVIYVFSVSYPLSTQEQLFIRTCILPQKYTKLLPVGNFSDVIDDAEAYGRVKDGLRRRFETILPDIQPFFLSALDERCRQLGAAVPNPAMTDVLQAGFEAFRNELADLLEDKAAYIIPDRIQRLLYAMRDDLDKDIHAIEEGLKLDSAQAKQKAADFEGRRHRQVEEQEAFCSMIDSKCALCRADSVEWTEALLHALERDVDSWKDKLSTDDIKRYYTLFCVDTLHTAFAKCTDYFLSVIYEELNKVSDTLMRDFSLDSLASSPSFVFEVDNLTYTAGDRLAFAGDLLSSSVNIGILSFISSYIAGTMREKDIDKKAVDYIASIKSQLAGLRTSVTPAMAKTFVSVAEAAKGQIAAYFETSRKNMENEITQTMAVVGQNEEQKKEIEGAVSMLKGILSQMRDKLITAEVTE